ncbi:MAG: hypothetical protein GY782_11305 [Gammaproteobacteria bacterium]|nr:hypothetical protein [Gammaproteobacteria bacterium]
MPIPPLDNWGSKLRAVPRQMEGGSSSTDPGQCDNEEDHPELEEEEDVILMTPASLGTSHWLAGGLAGGWALPEPLPRPRLPPRPPRPPRPLFPWLEAPARRWFLPRN